ncbi:MULTISPECIES: TIGR03943 family putative permease subunit [Streptomyces]|uniref:TIGR03943 family putative permease subunit n=1 Tax=Streptomyces TaxID=1883 RepID=UPI002250890A|nr:MULTISPECIES: TIGR03943 family protein [Streptomyces]MCX4435345.1 TIGR03943 family protein [Streptomyces mirabilis]
MKRPLQVTLLVLSGLGLLHASLFTDLSLRFVKEGMRPMLVASGVLLLVLGVAEAWSHQKPAGEDGHDHEDADANADTDADAERHVDAHGHDHSTVPRIAWLLFLPALSLLFYAPPALGAYTAAREAPKAVTEQRYFDPLPATSPVPLTLTQFTSRVQQDHKRDIGGRSVRMTGFVTPDKGADGWYLTRIIFTCCAADAQSVKVRIHGASALPANTWVTVTGTWHPGGTLGTSSAPAALDARTVKKVAKPVNAYTDALPLF